MGGLSTPYAARGPAARPASPKRGCGSFYSLPGSFYSLGGSFYFSPLSGNHLYYYNYYLYYCYYCYTFRFSSLSPIFSR